MIDQALIVARKEIVEIVHNRRLCVLLIVLSAILGVLMPFQVWSSRFGSAEAVINVLNAYISFTYLGCATGLAWGLIQETFFGEKARKTLETLLSTPLSLPAIWLGKTLATVAVSGVAATPAAGMFFLAINLLARSGTLALPAMSALFQGLVVTPLLLLAFVGLSGVSLWLLIDPRLAMGISMVAIFAIHGLGMYLGSNWLMAGLALAIAIGLLGLTAAAVRLLERERVVLAIR